MGTEDSGLLMRYLLGDLSESEKESLEEQYFAKDDVWEALNAAEHELIDMYVRGSLPRGQQEQFENYFLDSPRKRKQLDFARTLLSAELRAALAENPARTRGAIFGQLLALLQKGWRPGLRIALAATAVVATGLSLFLAIQNKKLKDQVNAQKSGSANHQSVAYSPTPQPTPSTVYSYGALASLTPADSGVLSLFLTAGMVRDVDGNNQVKRVMLSDAVQSVVLHLALEEDSYPRYDVVIRTAEGKQIEHADGIRSRATKNSGHIVLLKILPQRLAKGDYVVKLSGRTPQGESQEVDSYAFSVIR